MDRRKLRLILLGVVGVLILVIGIAAATITNPVQDTYAQNYGYDSWNEMPEGNANTAGTKAHFNSINPDLLRSLFTKWIVTWIVKPIGLFAILVAAIVVSRVVWDKTRPPSNSS